MQRSFNPEDMETALKRHPDLNPPNLNYKEWVDNTNNVMLKEDDSVGLATYEYPGVYTGHFFYTVHGRKALDLAERMIEEMRKEHGAIVLRGLTKTENKKVAWFQRKLGFVSHGVIDTIDGPHELFTLTLEKDK